MIAVGEHAEPGFLDPSRLPTLDVDIVEYWLREDRSIVLELVFEIPSIVLIGLAIDLLHELDGHFNICFGIFLT